MAPLAGIPRRTPQFLIRAVLTGRLGLFVETR